MLRNWPRERRSMLYKVCNTLIGIGTLICRYLHPSLSTRYAEKLAFTHKSICFLPFAAGDVEDKNTPTLVEGLVGRVIMSVCCGSDDAHTLALENNGWLVCHRCDVMMMSW